MPDTYTLLQSCLNGVGMASLPFVCCASVLSDAERDSGP